MKRYHCIFLSWIAFFMSACACGPPKNMFVLMPDADGSVGKITIKNDAGDQVIATAGNAVTVKNTNTAPAPPEAISEKDIQNTFKHAMSATPLPKKQFILQFKSGTTVLTQSSQALLPEITATVQARLPCEIRVIGHTDTAGDARKNWDLGLQRAEYVKEALIDQGIDANRIEAVSHGEKDLRILTEDNIAEPRNRRVEVLIQ